VLTARLFSLSLGKERGEASQPFLATAQEVLSRQWVGEFPETLGGNTIAEGIGALLEIDAFLAHAVRQPMVLVEADPSGERKVRAHAHKHPPPPLVVDIEVVLHNPAVCDLKMPAVCFLVADRGHDTRGFSRLEDDDDLIRPCALEVGVDKFVATALRSLDDWSVPLGRSLLHPDLKLFCGTAQDIATDRIEMPVNVENADHSLGLLKWLNEPVQQDAVETPIIEADAVLVMIVEGVHDRLLLLGRHQDSLPMHHLAHAQILWDIKGEALG